MLYNVENAIFSIFFFFHFFNFNINLVKSFIRNLLISRQIFKDCLKFYYVTQSFRIRKFFLYGDLFNILWNLWGSFFLCLIFANWRNLIYLILHTWDKALKSGLSKFCGRQPLKNLKEYGLLVQYASKGIWSLQIKSACIACLQNTGCWKWVFVILIISIFHFNLTFFKSLTKKYKFLRWTFKVFLNFQCFSKFEDVIIFDSEVAAFEIFIKLCVKLLLLCLLFLDWRNFSPGLWSMHLGYIIISN